MKMKELRCPSNDFCEEGVPTDRVSSSEALI